MLSQTMFINSSSSSTTPTPSTTTRDPRLMHFQSENSSKAAFRRNVAFARAYPDAPKPNPHAIAAEKTRDALNKIQPLLPPLKQPNKPPRFMPTPEAQEAKRIQDLIDPPLTQEDIRERLADLDTLDTSLPVFTIGEYGPSFTTAISVRAHGSGVLDSILISAAPGTYWSYNLHTQHAPGSAFRGRHERTMGTDLHADSPLGANARGQRVTTTEVLQTARFYPIFNIWNAHYLGPTAKTIDPQRYFSRIPIVATKQPLHVANGQTIVLHIACTNARHKNKPGQVHILEMLGHSDIFRSRSDQKQKLIAFFLDPQGRILATSFGAGFSRLPYIPLSVFRYNYHLLSTRDYRNAQALIPMPSDYESAILEHEPDLDPNLVERMIHMTILKLQNAPNFLLEFHQLAASIPLASGAETTDAHKIQAVATTSIQIQRGPGSNPHDTIRQPTDKQQQARAFLKHDIIATAIPPTAANQLPPTAPSFKSTGTGPNAHKQVRTNPTPNLSCSIQ